MFYESLYEEKPESEMAQEWCLQYGILDEKAAKKVFEIVCKRKGKRIDVESPVKQAKPSASKPAPAPAKKETTSKKKRKIDDDIDDTGECL